MSFHVPEQFRRIHPELGWGEGNNGFFIIRPKAQIQAFICIASDGAGWEHVSVSFPGRTPSWSEMCWVKDLFWDESDCVIQFHPAKSEYVNNHPFCLHLWRPTEVAFPKPHSSLVGIK